VAIWAGNCGFLLPLAPLVVFAVGAYLVLGSMSAIECNDVRRAVDEARRNAALLDDLRDDREARASTS
jgi:hypothetical protein